MVIKKEIECVKEAMCSRRILLFGCTLFSETISDALCMVGCEPYAFIDNNAAKVGQKCMGLNIYAPSDILQGTIDNYFIIICSKYHNEMKRQLMLAGIKEDQILDIPVSESLGEVSDSIESFNISVSSVKKGFELYQSINKDEYTVFLCPYPGTGDVYLACAHLRAYVQEIECGKYKLLVTKENCRKVAELFGELQVEVINEEDANLLLKAWEFLGSELMNIKPLLYWGWRTKRFLHADKHNQITFYDNFCYDAFGFKNRVAIDNPSSSGDKTALRNYIEKYGIKEGKTVIVAPYAGSFISQIKQDEWEEVTERLKQIGYTVFTNCSDNEKEIEGTKRIFFPYKIAIPLLEYSGMFIGVRTGLCEILSSAKCNQVIVYESGFAASDYEYFSIKKMGLNSSVNEVVYGRNEKNLMEIVIPLLEGMTS